MKALTFILCSRHSRIEVSFFWPLIVKWTPSILPAFGQGRRDGVLWEAVNPNSFAIHWKYENIVIKTSLTSSVFYISQINGMMLISKNHQSRELTSSHWVQHWSKVIFGAYRIMNRKYFHSGDFSALVTTKVKAPCTRTMHRWLGLQNIFQVLYIVISISVCVIFISQWIACNAIIVD